MSHIVLSAQERVHIGKGASRRLRHAQKVPAIVYGAHMTPIAVELEHRHVVNLHRNKEIYSQIITLDVAGTTHQAIIKQLDRHVYKNKVLHIEFQALSGTDKITVDVSLNFLNADRCVGAKKGGELSVYLKSMKIRCLPSQLPAHIDVDLANLDLEQIIHLSDLALPAGVESSDLAYGKDHDLAVVAVHALKDDSQPAKA